MSVRLTFAVTCCALMGCAALAPPSPPPGEDTVEVPPAKPPRKPAPDEGAAPGVKGCDGIDAWGTCRENVALRCEAGVLVSTICVAPLSRCALIDDVEGHGCVAPEDAPLAPPDSPDAPAGGGCGGIDYLGTCEGDVVVFCDEGTLTRVDCGRWQQACGFVDAETGWYCIRDAGPDDAPPEADPVPDAPPAPPPPEDEPAPAPPSDTPAPPSDTPAPPSGAPAPPSDSPAPPDAPVDDPCRGLDYLGRCTGDVAEWCENGVVVTRDCRTVDGTACGWVSAELGWYCGGEPSPAPDEPVAPEPPPAPEPPAEDTPPGPGRDCYEETWYPDASLAPVAARLRADWQAAAVDAMRLRWPAGHALLAQGAMDDLRSFGDGASLSALAESMMTVIHEGTHGWDYGHASGNRTFAYFLRGDLTLEIPWIDGFPRSELLADLPDDATRTYADTYLSGDQGTRGFAELMDEGNCYINGMIALTVLGDAFEGAGISARDGAVAFLLYTQLYLRRARLQHPQVYAELQGDASVRRLVDLQWRRAHYWLSISDQYPALGIADDRIRAHLYTPENLGELNRFLGLTLSASNCR